MIDFRAIPILAVLVGLSPKVAADFSGDVDVSENWFKKTDTAIGDLTDLIKSMPNSDGRATRMVQLAELHYQKSTKLKMRGGKTDLQMSQEALRKAVEILEHVVAKHPKNNRHDIALFVLGRCYTDLGKKKNAEAVFLRLAEVSSGYLVHLAYVELGDLYRSAGDLEKAREMYEKGGSLGELRLESPLTTNTAN